ncbi:hypothetical protein ABH923_001230 [Leifsonia sp. EB41]|uniref:hypothetical protein n=1 Tax=Leifsonia sp. EB41 TaxID=3156260 RepID=UPI0035118865
MNIERRSRPGSTIDGFVLVVGRDWVLLSKTTEGGYFDGHAAIRISDIKRARPDRSFQSDFARTQPDWPPSLPLRREDLDLDSTKSMLRSLLVAGHMIGIERDLRVEAIWIGVPDGLTKKFLYLWEVTPQATWHEAPLGYKLKTIRTVIFDDRYQTALAAMAGNSPADAASDWAHDLEKMR